MCRRARYSDAFVKDWTCAGASYLENGIFQVYCDKRSKRNEFELGSVDKYPFNAHPGCSLTVVLEAERSSRSFWSVVARGISRSFRCGA